MTDNQCLIALGLRDAGMTTRLIAEMLGLRAAKVKATLRDIDRDYQLSLTPIVKGKLK